MAGNLPRAWDRIKGSHQERSGAKATRLDRRAAAGSPAPPATPLHPCRYFTGWSWLEGVVVLDAKLVVIEVGNPQ